MGSLVRLGHLGRESPFPFLPITGEYRYMPPHPAVYEYVKMELQSSCLGGKNFTSETLFFILACQSMDTAIVTRYSDKPWAPLHPDFTVPVSRGPVFCCAPHSYSSLYVDGYSSL